MDLVKIGAGAAAECVRQKVGLRELGYLLDGYLWLSEYDGILNVTVMETLGSFVEPAKNHNGFRKTPVTFSNGGSSAPASEIPRLMINLRDAIGYGPWDNHEGVIDRLVKEFLWIHPFADGNGRVAYLLYNYLSGTMDSPKPLPYYFGEK